MNDIDFKDYIKSQSRVDRIFLFCIVIILGAMMNLFALVENGGRMPVYTNENFSTESHFSFNNSSEVRSFWFTDMVFGKSTNNISFGDIIMYVGFFSAVITWIIGAVEMYYRIKRKKSDRSLEAEAL